MSATVRRLVGVAIAVLALGGGTTVFSAQRHRQLDAARLQAQSDVDAELPKVVATLEGLSKDVATAATRAANLQAIKQLLPQITTQSDRDDLARTFAGFETEPFFAPFSAMGPHAFFLGTTSLYTSDQALMPALESLATVANANGTATGIVAHEGTAWLIGVGRSEDTNPQQQPVLVALARKVTKEVLEPVASQHGVALLLVSGPKPTDRVGAGGAAALDTLSRWLTSMKAPTEPCCSQRQLAPGVELAVLRDFQPRIAAAEAEASSTAVPIFGLAGVLALGSLLFGFRTPRAQDDESARLLRETAAQLKQSQEQLQRLSQNIATTPTAPSLQPVTTGLESTQASVQQSRYEVVAPLGEGGMARVAVAVVRGAEGFKRTFVLKRLRPELAGNTEVVAQFIDEARLGASLVHSNIVPVFDFGRDADGYFLAQEYILGRDVDALITASKRVRGTALSSAEASFIGQEALKALSYAHTRVNDAGKFVGLVHRDVSPNNLMVSARGEVKLLDFGIVKSDERATKTQAGVVKGNLFFMSPEQARALDVDARADLFSLGMVLFSALNGDPLYEGNNVYELMNRAAAGPTDADRERVRAACGPLADVVLRALSSDPAERFPDALQFGAALAAAVPAASAAQLQALMEQLFTQEFAEERQRFSV